MAGSDRVGDSYTRPMGRSADSADLGTDRTSAVLFVSDERGWPRTSGYRRRTSQLLTAVADVGPTTWVVAPRNLHDAGEPVVVPDGLADRVTVRHVPAPTRPRWQVALRWITSDLPWPLAAGDWRPADRHLEKLAAQRYDLIWAMGIDAYMAVQRAGLQAPVIVVDADLESLKLRRRLATGAVSSRVRRAMALIDERRWRRLERRTAATVTRFSVCSDEEGRILGSRAMTTPNGYPLVLHDRAGGDRGDSSVLLFVGSLSYGPNLDGLRWFTSDVWPTVRGRVADVELRVVGSGGDELEWLAAAPGVTLVGPVDELDDELGRAGAVVAPIPWGAGTRIKILEAFAHRVPVISTTIGAEGLDVRDDRELLLADDPARFADACVRALEDRELRARLIDGGYETFVNHYEESAICHGLTARLNELIDSARSASPTRSR